MANFPYGGNYGGNGNISYDSATGSVKYGDNLISTQLPIYTYGSHPYPWDVPFGTEILIHPNCLTGSGANTQGIKLRSDNTNWCFADRGQMIYAKSGTLAAPLVSGVVGAGATEVSLLGSLNQPMLPAYLLYKGCRGRFRCKVQKTNANGTWDVIVRLGTHAIASDCNANDALINFPSVTNASGRQFWVDVEFCVTSAGRAGSGATAGETTAYMITTNFITANGQTTSGLADKNNIFSTVDTIYFNINTKNANAADTFALIEYSLELLP